MKKTVTGPIEQLRQRIGRLDRQQIIAWQRMSPVERLDIAFQAYQFALEAVRLTDGEPRIYGKTRIEIIKSVSFC